MTIDGSFKSYKRKDMKPMYNLKLENEKCSSEKCIIAKRLKPDENIQYCSAMAKPMPTTCFRQELDEPNLKKVPCFTRNCQFGR